MFKATKTFLMAPTRNGARRFVTGTFTMLLILMSVSGQLFAQPGTVQSLQKIADGSGGLAANTLTDGNFFGSAAVNIGDLNSDGIPELAVGADGDDTGGNNRGALYILFMNADGTVASSVKIADGVNGLPADALSNNGSFGISVAVIGDLDNNGVPELAVGAYSDNTGGTDRGAVYVLFMNSDGTVSSHVKIAHNTGGLGSLTNFDQFGLSVAGIGDWDNDGIPDLAVGAQGDNTGGSNRGAIHILFLNADGTVDSQAKIADGVGGLAANTLKDSDNFGSSVAAIGDLDNNGLTELAVGARLDDDGGGVNSNYGALYILFMKTDGTVDSHVRIANGDGGLPASTLSTVDQFGFSVTKLGDLNNDGIPDLAVGALGDDTGGSGRGAVYILFLNANGTVDSQAKIADGTGGLAANTLSNGDLFGSSVAAIGDLNNDGVPELGVGAEHDDTGGGDRGAFYVLFLVQNCFTVTNTDDSGEGSLRQAILDANAQPNRNASTPDTIKFNITGAGPHVITPATGLPNITDPVIIDGSTQPGNEDVCTLAIPDRPTYQIVLDGGGGIFNGLVLTTGSDGSTIQGLNIRNFGLIGILISGTSSSNSLSCNFIGTDADGVAAVANTQRGIQINSGSGNLVGGTTPGAGNLVSGNGETGVRMAGTSATGNFVQGNFIGTDKTGATALTQGQDGVTIQQGAKDNIVGGTTPGVRNVISGNHFFGVQIASPNTTGNLVQGNFIGTDLTGTSAVPNSTQGVVIQSQASGNTIGGTAPGAGNVISGNAANGVRIEDANTSGNLVQGNLIGTAANGTTPLPNTVNGVLITQDASGNTVGGTVSGAGNTIAFNKVDGVGVAGTAAISNAILGNSIFNNGDLGIDLVNDGVSLNDPSDIDAGPNNVQNFPVLTSAETDGGGSITIIGTFNSTSGISGYRLEFFANTVCNGDQNGVAQTDDYGEGETFLGFTTVSTDGSGDASFSVTLSVTVPAGAFITATATAPDNSTSEFSQCVEATEVCPAELTINNASAGVQALIDDPETDPDALAALEAAKDALTVALGHAQSEDIEAFFYALRDAADALEEAREDIDGTDPIASSLADLARCIAEQKREAALECDPTPSGKMADDIEDGDNDLADGGEEYNDGYFGDAIKDFRKAWEDYCSALARCEDVSKTSAPGHSDSDGESAMPTEFALQQNYPNPFNPSTTIRFDLPQAHEVTLTIYNIYGQRVRQLVAGQMNAGRHSVVWDATNDHGQKVVSGVYLYVIKAGEFIAQRRLVLMK